MPCPYMCKRLLNHVGHAYFIVMSCVDRLYAVLISFVYHVDYMYTIDRYKLNSTCTAKLHNVDGVDFPCVIHLHNMLNIMVVHA